MNKDLRPDAVRAVDFISWLNSEAKLYLEQMSSVGQARPSANTYAQKNKSAALSFIELNNSETLRRNLYFLPNAEFLNGKRKKDNLTSARFLHVDLDMKDYPGTGQEQADHILALLTDPNIRPAGIPYPTAFWFTGGGYQAVWRLTDPMLVNEAEALNRALLFILQGGPGTHDPSRLLRLPCTINWLNEKKRAAGREPKLALLFHPVRFDATAVSYTREDIRIRIPKSEASPMPKSVAETEEPEQIVPLELPEDLSEILPSEPEWVEAIVTGRNPPNKSYSSRSELVFACVIWMLGRGVEPGYVLSIITERELGISAHVLENPNPLKYGQRQVVRGMDLVERRSSRWPVTDKEGNPVRNHPDNVRHALALLEIDAQRNTFTQSDEFTGLGLDGRDLNDIVEILWSKFISELHFNAKPAVIKRVLLTIAHEQKYHPVIDYLDGLEWDGVRRIDRWLIDYCHAEDTELHREFGSKLLVAGVRRTKNPGVKFDTMLVLEGAQGAGKSRLAAKLAVRDEWFCGSLDLRSDDKTKAELLARAWVVECQELDGLNKSTSENLKRFLSTSIDTYRRAYARDAGEYRRHCIIIGTTNEGAYLRDLTGNRRIWPVRVGSIDLDRFTRDVDQLWAEAAAREREGGSITLSEHLWNAAAELQSNRMVEDAYAEVLEATFAEETGKISMASVKLLLGLDTVKMTPTDTRRIKAAMAVLGWQYGTHRLRDSVRNDRRPLKGFAAGNDEERKVEIIAERHPNGVVRIVPLKDGPDEKNEIPF